MVQASQKREGRSKKQQKDGMERQNMIGQSDRKDKQNGKIEEKDRLERQKRKIVERDRKRDSKEIKR